MAELFAAMEDFFTDYAAALNANDEDVVMSFLAIPHGVRIGPETTFIETPEELRAHMDVRMMRHEAAGTDMVHITVEEVSGLPGDAAAVRLHWELIDEEGSEAACFDTRETLAAMDGVWAIVASDLTDEIAVLARHGQELPPGLTH
ncbi:hypothetical protein KCG44_04600 [Pacificimonas sp. WHA3]|uniref:SnoaL-like domain-containing protein n=1 Tax=Pacificimonas pallii TaxID=2827236 RepID=A0ABS6SDR4_9SPHN|nr:hypothetical protein [Pacificimonas pallii]MBV7256061.1 hypothetical protein [Pacificimonas pallii]